MRAIGCFSRRNYEAVPEQLNIGGAAKKTDFQDTLK